jgi:WD40 repeat protein
MLSLQNRRLVSWGGEGAIRFWDLEGHPLAGGALDAHFGGVEGVLVLDNERLVSWGEADCAIRFWDLEGRLLPDGDPAAHLGGVKGVLVLQNGLLVSWDREGVICLWDRFGRLQSIPWLAPARLEIVTTVKNEVWLCLQGRPFRLVLDS